MKKRLSVIIPRYKEDEKAMFPLLSSISNQLAINIDEVEVVIGNDGEGAGPLSDEYLAQFGVDIRQVNLPENKGCGLARQAAMDAAVGDYLFFCDADDIIHNVLVMGRMLDEITKTEADVLSTDFFEEIKMQNGAIQYIRHAGHIGCWMHGKMMRRQFLIYNNIRFHEKFREHEDAYFLSVVWAKAKNTRYLPELTYVWRSNPDSITRKDNSIYTYYSVPIYIDAVTTAFEEIERTHPEQMEQRVAQLIYYHFFMLQRADWMHPDKAEYKAKAEAALREKIAPYWHYYENASPALKVQEYNAERERSFKGGIESETLDKWLERVFGGDGYDGG